MISSITAVALTLVYSILISVILYRLYDKEIVYEVTALTAYSIQLIAYCLAVCICLLPAMDKLD